jgi:hypothetical protein
VLHISVEHITHSNQKRNKMGRPIIISEKNIVKAYKVMHLVTEGVEYRDIGKQLGFSRTSASIYIHGLILAFKKLTGYQPLLDNANAWTVKNNPATFMIIMNKYINYVSCLKGYKYAIAEIQAYRDEVIDIKNIKEELDETISINNDLITAMSSRNMLRSRSKIEQDTQMKEQKTMFQIVSEDITEEAIEDCYDDPSDKQLIQELNEHLDFAVDELGVERRENIRLNKIINRLIGLI